MLLPRSPSLGLNEPTPVSNFRAVPAAERRVRRHAPALFPMPGLNEPTLVFTCLNLHVNAPATLSLAGVEYSSTSRVRRHAPASFPTLG